MGRVDRIMRLNVLGAHAFASKAASCASIMVIPFGKSGNPNFRKYAKNGWIESTVFVSRLIKQMGRASRRLRRIKAAVAAVESPLRQFISIGGYSWNTFAPVTRICWVYVRGGTVCPFSIRSASGSTS